MKYISSYKKIITRSAYCRPTDLGVTLALLAAVLVGTGATTISQAQTEFDIKSQSSDLEQEYRQELDKWMLRAYEGDRDAQFKVGVLFTNSQFDEPDYEQAVYWYKQAARQGHVLAQYNLGHQYLMGVGVVKDETTAMEWWLQAAEQDHALAQFNVGRAYYLGIGLGEDHELSRYWFNRAAQNQEPKSIQILKQLGWSEGSEGEVDSSSLASNAGSGTATTPAGTTPDEQGDDQQSTLVSKIVPTAVESASADGATGAAGSTGKPAWTTSGSAVADSKPSAPVTSTATVSPTPAAAKPAESKPAPSRPETAKAAKTTVADGGKTETPAGKPVPTALYTNPGVRSVLIAIIDDRSSLNVVGTGKNWHVVTSTEGFPVWVHGDYVAVTDKLGAITGSAVNARSVPIVTTGTVVGKLEKGEVVKVLDKRKDWYRIVAPKRFRAWVKADEFDRSGSVADNTSSTNGRSSSSPSSSAKRTGSSQQKPAATAKRDNPAPATQQGSRPVNDNEWLYSQPVDNYTLQLASFDDPEKINEFVSRAKFIDNPNLHRFTSKNKEIEWTYFLYGSYDDKATAEATKTKINQKRAWIRTFGLLQQNRCVAWKKQLPTPSELNKYCGS